MQFFKKEFCTINVHCLFFGFYFILFNDVDIPQVALLSAFFALAQKDKKDKLMTNKCLWIQRSSWMFMLIFDSLVAAEYNNCLVSFDQTKQNLKRAINRSIEFDRSYSG